MPLKIANIGARERAAVRRERALALRIQGTPFREIGRQLGVSGKTAHKDISRSLADLAAREQDKAREQRQLDLARIDKALAGLAPKIDSGDPQAVNALCRLLERRARLLGLDAPQRTLHGGDPASPPIEVAVAAMTISERTNRLSQLIAAVEARSVPALPYHPPANGNGHADGAGGTNDQ